MYVCVFVIIFYREKVKAVPEELKVLKANKHYLHATELLTITGTQIRAYKNDKYFTTVFTIIVTQLDKDLAMIDALRELKAELRAHKEVHCYLIFYCF